MESGASGAETEFHNQLKADAEFWEKTFQTAQDPNKTQAFINDAVTYRNSSRAIPIKKAIDTARPAFAGESGTNADKLCRILFYIALHESDGGRYDRPVGGGPARGWWQVRPDSARSIIKNGGAMWGPRARLATGYSLATLKIMSDKELGELLLVPAFCCAMAAFIAITRAQDAGQLDYLRG
jgi:hypothetical protein